MFNEIYAILSRITADNDFTAMDYAVKEKFCDVENENDETIFYHSIKQCNIKLARLIMEFSQNNCSHIMLKNSDFNKFFLKTRHFDVNEVLTKASNVGHHETIKLLLTVPGIDVNTKDRDKWTALNHASYHSHYEIVKLLLIVPGIDVNAKNRRNETALMNASKKGHLEVVKLLLTVSGIDVNAKDYWNDAPLIMVSS